MVTNEGAFKGGLKSFFKGKWYLSMLLPAAIILAMVGAYPLIYQFVISLTDLNLAFPADAGATFGNYVKLVADPVFWHSMGVLLFLCFFGVLFTMIFGIFLALLAFRIPPARRLMPFLIIPMIATPIVVANFYQYLYSADYGLIRYVLEIIGLYPGFNITSHPNTVLWSIIAIDVWQWTPFVMLIVWAGLNSIPTDILDACKVDGANAWQSIIKVILPMQTTALGTAAIFRTVEGMRAFVIIWGLTRGGPGNSSEVTSIYLYNTAFRSLDLGYAAAIGTGMVLLTIVICFLLNRTLVRLNNR
jgi:multiple sugar transport system permease protein